MTEPATVEVFRTSGRLWRWRLYAGGRDCGVAPGAWPRLADALRDARAAYPAAAFDVRR